MISYNKSPKNYLFLSHTIDIPTKYFSCDYQLRTINMTGLHIQYTNTWYNLVWLLLKWYACPSCCKILDFTYNHVADSSTLYLDDNIPHFILSQLSILSIHVYNPEIDISNISAYTHTVHISIIL